tara:strand:+ start:233 stop:823 length:591 start_codon:yes stop_codon:yes gene_type:complete
MTKQSHADIIKEICKKIDRDVQAAKDIVNKKYPHEKLKKDGRQYNEKQKTKIFRRDGFIDQYSGEKLIYPPVLKILSVLLERDFPYQKHWKMSETHIAWWELIPTVDHVEPVARGGEDKEWNWVCTSQLRNSAKSNWKLEELGWKRKKEIVDLKKWDGMMGWFMEYMKTAPKKIRDDKYITKWHKAANDVIREEKN